MPSTPARTTPRNGPARTKKPAPAVSAGDQPSSSAAIGETTTETAPMDEQTRDAMIRMVAFRFYERRGYVSGSELQDWLDAEMEVDRALAAQAPGVESPTTAAPARKRKSTKP